MGKPEDEANCFEQSGRRDEYCCAFQKRSGLKARDAVIYE